MIDPGIKFEPLMVRIKSELPTFTEDGFNDKIAGAGFDVGLTASSTPPELPPPGPGLTTITSAVPEFAKSAAVICACNCVLEEKVVARELPFH